MKVCLLISETFVLKHNIFFLQNFYRQKYVKEIWKGRSILSFLLWKKVANMSVNQLSDYTMVYVVSLKDNWPLNYADIKQLSVHCKPIIEKIAFARFLSAFECW